MDIKRLIAKHYAETGEELTHKDLGLMIWPDEDPESSRIKLSRYQNKKNQKVDFHLLGKLREIFKISLDDLIPKEYTDNFNK